MTRHRREVSHHRGSTKSTSAATPIAHRTEVTGNTVRITAAQDSNVVVTATSMPKAPPVAPFRRLRPPTPRPA